MGELERDGDRFHAVDDGQAMVLTYVSDDAARLNTSAGRRLLEPVVPR